MRRLLYSALLFAAVSPSIGCIVPMYSAQPNVRARQLIFTSEDFRQATDIWERMWFLDMPDLETPYRTHGGII